MWRPRSNVSPTGFRINTSILVRPYGQEKEKDEDNEYYNRLAYQLKTQQLILKALLTMWNSDT